MSEFVECKLYLIGDYFKNRSLKAADGCPMTIP
jgi:hypothetical protein